MRKHKKMKNTQTTLEQMIHLCIFDDNTLSINEEKKCVTKAVELGMTVENALTIITTYCNKNNILLERKIDENLTSQLNGACSDGSVSKKEFDTIVEYTRTLTGGKWNNPSIYRKLKGLINKNGLKVKEGGLFGTNWFTDIS